MLDPTCTQCGQRLEPEARYCRACGTAVSSPTRSSPRPQPRANRLSARLLPILLVVGAALIGLSLLLSRVDPPAVVDIPDEHDVAGLPYPEVPRISVAETKERLDGGTSIIVDVRSPGDYAEAHIPGALSIPLDDLQSRYQELPQAAEIITYCT